VACRLRRAISWRAGRASPGAGTRPASTFGPAFPFVIVTPLTTTRRGLSLHVGLEPTNENGLDDTSYVQCELLRSVNRKRLVRQLGNIDIDTSLRVASVVKTLLNY
jgi:mRNA interferase MazF